MGWLIYVFDGLGIIATIVSVIAAYRACKYYKKAKYIFQRDKCKKAFDTMGTIKSKMDDLLSLANPQNISRGKNVEIAITEFGRDISNLINSIQANLSQGEWEQISNCLKNEKKDFQNFITSLITAQHTVYKNDKIVFDNISSCFDDYLSMLNRAYESLKGIIETYGDNLS